MKRENNCCSRNLYNLNRKKTLPKFGKAFCI
jgi:hypothetical protein